MAHKQRAGLATAKLAMIHVARRKIGMEEADYRLFLLRMAGVESARDLTEAGFRQVMDGFAHLGFQSDSAARNFGRRPGMAGAGHVAAMRRLWLEYTGGTGTDATLGKWLERTWGVSALRFVTAAHAPKVVAVLKQMVARGAGLTDGAA
ncbi:regulatory protein GemA [Sediminicoccus sp. KRV36]|uniref:regulatory protein GemA n=1 Tax=Sediminicoccus sp. KRV36 TaxID=3133721 RepID=UPI00200C4537|nr:regulatory protein GemA [Sediminicoccus rosea]UPY36206.1 regulatory protein GemA [Sediminicoccus rosea]